jgi:hypothetical protein
VLAAAEVTVVSLGVDVCGVVDHQNVLRSSTDAQQFFVRLRGSSPAVGSTVCVTGRLDEGPQLPELEVTTPLP